MTNETQQLIEKLRQTIKGTKFENKAFIAGGFVRDMQLGIDNKDIDICVELPNGGIELAEFLTKELNGTNVVIFERFGTAQIVVDGMELEFVMTRKETYSENDRNCEVEFGTIQDDVLRRDFTINSMLLNISTGKIIDLCGGKKDLEAKIIRTTSEPQIIFNEDPLRIIRALRFAAKLGFRIELSTFNAIAELAPRLNLISRERIQEEFMKILGAKHFEMGLKFAMNFGITDIIGLPELRQTQGMTQNKFHTKDVFGHILDVMNNAKPTAMHRLAALLHDIGKVTSRSIDEDGSVHFFAHEIHSKKISDRFMKDLKFSNDDVDLIGSAVVNHMRISSDISSKKIRQIRSQLGDNKFEFLLDLCEADRLAHVDKSIEHIKAAREIKESEVNITPSNLLVNGNDIQTLFRIKPGPIVGELLTIVSNMMFENPNVTRDEIISVLNKVVLDY